MKKKKKTLIVILSIVLIACSGLAFYLWQKANHFFYLVNQEEKSELTLTYEFGEEIDLTPQGIQLTALKGDKPCEIQYEIPEITEIKTYEIDYTVADQKDIFKLTLEVTDHTAPVISGEMKYKVIEGEDFNLENLKLKATDNFDLDLTQQLKMPKVDTSEPGKQEIDVSVTDSNGNDAKVTIQLEVKKKKVSPTRPSGQIIVSNPNDIHVLINKTHYLPDGWAPNDLVQINANNGQKHYLRSEAANQWEAARQAALNDGVNIKVVSSYRTQSYQANLYNNYMATDPVNAPYYSAYPRTSEHETGLAMDISYDGSLHDDLHNSKVGSWMNENGWKYGWIMRYLDGKSNLTGYVFEAWHYRYVGVDLATELHEKNITLEEYYQ